LVKKIGSLIIAAIVMTSFALAEVPILISPKPTQEVTMTLAELKKYAKEHNKNLIELEKTADDMKDQYEDVKEADREMQIWKFHSQGFSFETSAEYELYHGYTMKKAQLGYDVFLKQKELTEETIFYSVESLVYNREQLVDAKKYLTKMIANSEKEIIIANVQLKFNMITQSQYDMIKLKKESLAVELLGVENNLKTVDRTLKELVGLDVSTQLSVILDNQFETVIVEDLEKVANDATGLRLDALQVEQDYVTKTIAYELAEKTKRYGINKDEYKEIKRVYTNVEVSYPIDMEAIKDKVRSSYENLLKSEIAYKNAEATYNLSKASFDVTEKSYQVGLISQIKYETAKLELENSENSLKKALYDNILAKEMFRINSTVGEEKVNS